MNKEVALGVKDCITGRGVNVGSGEGLGTDVCDLVSVATGVFVISGKLVGGMFGDGSGVDKSILAWTGRRVFVGMVSGMFVQVDKKIIPATIQRQVIL
jgi:hypothetical protein